jgi:hypothetical protein
MAIAATSKWSSLVTTPICRGYSSSSSGKPLVSFVRPHSVQYIILTHRNIDDSPQAYISLSSHPHFNLSLEHYLLRSRPVNTPLCLLYRNDPCIVVGRNQNPWRELDVTRMRELGIKLVRRRSGGGSVYHVSDNDFFSFFLLICKTFPIPLGRTWETQTTLFTLLGKASQGSNMLLWLLGR